MHKAEKYPTKQAINAVIRKPHKVHKRNRIKKIAYFLRKHKIGQRVSYTFIKILTLFSNSESSKNRGEGPWLLSIWPRSRFKER